ncbi:hypothetical protein OOK27_22280 [Streptomyces canus]|nr:hypothetical protein [Streptomyces canus]MCX5256826.1 hypothetical protein [Streptomyces canus]
MGVLSAVVVGAFVFTRPHIGQILMVAATVGVGVVMFLRPS